MSSWLITEPNPVGARAVAVVSRATGGLASSSEAAPRSSVSSDGLHREPTSSSRLYPGADPREMILALYDEYRPRLFRYMCSMHLGHESAEEVIQETFMRLTTTLLKDTEIENVQGWIVRVAHNLAVDVLKRQRDGVISGDEVLFVIENRADPALNPEEAYAKKEKTRRMSAALSTLKPQHRECFQMRAQGLRYKAIGVALGISEQRAAFVVKQVAIQLAALCG